MSDLLLEVGGLNGWYDESHALHGMDFDIRRGEVVTLLGRNGVGKSTTLKAVMGVLRKRTGSVRFEGREMIAAPANVIARAGIAWCPEDRGIFGSLSVEENLLLPPTVRPGGFSLREIFDIFPNLEVRRASRGKQLSGGEQQMLAIARNLRTGATLLLLDEPTEGLAPVIVKAIGEVIRTISQRGISILLVEQNYRFAARLAHRHNIVVDGRIVDRFDRIEDTASLERIKSYLSV